MLSGNKLSEICKERHISAGQIAEHIVQGSFTREEAVKAVRNWLKGLYKPKPSQEQIEQIASFLGVETAAICEWTASHRYAPFSASKARLVTQLIAGREVQDALDVLTFTNKRAACHVKKVLQNAIANADEQEADTDSLYVSEARVDQAGRRIGTKTWHAKDRGRAHPIKKQASHIYVTVSQD